MGSRYSQIPWWRCEQRNNYKNLGIALEGQGYYAGAAVCYIQAHLQACQLAVTHAAHACSEILETVAQK